MSDGYWVTPPLISDRELGDLRIAADRLFAAAGGAKAGLRDPVSQEPLFSQLAKCESVVGLVEPIIGRGPFVVRSVLFDKTPEANWDVVWHQDVTITVKERADVEGYGPWSTKAGQPNVQPPAAVLEGMVTVRLHLDDCGETNGPLLVVPGSHRSGIIDVRTLDTAGCDERAVRCCAEAGAALVMRPLLLHASRKSQVASHRRVLHLDFAATALPEPLRWTTNTAPDNSSQLATAHPAPSAPRSAP
jgi:ectoine hydroxylase-related dioxygenase (phytanoyl-CoA dioxygenase family)